ncbi:assimilatory sulfite reductase (NADPH) flavoprotein subunit [Catalinimonas niigatensis]|uniref:assimilatory sulfite reductase (NADPH) flavoprotein subunit n=1 Tax=Catalinimonas niigatensis TaxID=1397264 RepID=UPI002666C105|nr:assimilatory sulfite reductase (NADPH) flavoprotein subunit [Catalinimonas niigatensis]WPP50717.1 assimilatory sulfite reductase (NADPH) flavoprotein subunit [Catalinimonas niigatensis]
MMDLKKGLSRGPFSDEQAEQLSKAMSGLDAGQLQWLSGYFTGVLQEGNFLTETQISAATQTETKAEKIVLRILFGSHTGNCEELAQELQVRAKERGIDVEVSDMASFKPRDLKKISHLAVLVSTHGIGEPPVMAEEFYNFLHGKKAPDLSHMQFSVLALGDTSYAHFCQTGKDIDQVLEKLGATRISDRVDCDVDFEEDAEKWMHALLSKLEQNAKPQQSTSVQLSSNGSAKTAKSKYNRKHPFEATVLEKINLNGRGSSKETIHLELDLEGSGLQYEPGDALGIYGANSPALVEEVLKALELSANDAVESHAGEKSLGEALTFDYELTPLTSVTMQRFAEATECKWLLDILEDNMKVMEYVQGRDLLDLLKEVPCKLSANELLSILRKNSPRMYSIASSQQAVEDEVHLLISVVRYEAHGRWKEGLCSSTLADRLGMDDKVKVFVDKNTRFRLPSDQDTPIIMVGPGTGIAPFRAFMQQREIMESEGESWLFFGERNFTTDFLYQTEWQQYLKEGILSRMDVAFSRDQQDKQYVQHKMLDQGKALFDWLERGAHFYVCGDAQRMAKDVDNTLKQIVQKYGGLTSEKADEYVKYMQVTNRYQTDIY